MRHDGDDQLRGIAEGGIQQAADALPGVVRQVFGGIAEPSRQRQDGQAGCRKDEGVGFRREELKPDRDRDKKEKPAEHR